MLIYLLFGRKYSLSLIEVHLGNFVGSNQAPEVLTKDKSDISFPDNISQVHPVMEMIVLV